MKSILFNNYFSSSIKSLLIKFIGIIAGTIISVIVTNKLGASELGIITLSNKLLAILIVFGSFGFDTLLIKEFSNSKRKIKESKSFNTGINLVGLFSFFILILGILFSKNISFLLFDQYTYSSLIVVFLIGLIPNSLIRIFSSAINGKGYIWQSILFNEVLINLLVFISLGLNYFFKFQISVLKISFLYTIFRIIVFFITHYFFLKKIKIKVNSFKIDLSIFKNTINMYLINIVAVLNATFDLVIISIFLSNYELGVYSVVIRISLALIIILQVSNSILKPKISNLFFNNNLKELNILKKKSIKYIGFFSLLIFIIIVIFGEFILQLWGEEFKTAYTILVIVSFGQMVNATTGPVGSILVMCGREKEHKYLSVFMFFLSLIILPYLTYHYKLIGASVGLTSLLVIENLTKLILVKKYFKIS